MYIHFFVSFLSFLQGTERDVQLIRAAKEDMMENVKLFQKLTDMEQLLRDSEDQELMSHFDEILMLIRRVQENANASQNKLLAENDALALQLKTMDSLADHLSTCEKYSRDIQVDGSLLFHPVVTCFSECP